MKLSDAIRLGSMLRPRQAFHVWIDAHGGSCAVGAAMEAVGILHEDGSYDRAPFEWEPLVCQTSRCPVCAKKHRRVDTTMIHLNNEHRWTREQIADWVEQIERAHAPAETRQAVSLLAGGME